MKNSHFKIFLSLFVDHPSTKKFFIGVLLGMSFSIAVILTTIGLMDGFDFALKEGLRKANGDFVMHSRSGFFSLEKSLQEKLTENGISYYSKVVQTESFLIHNETTKGVLVKGVDNFYADIVSMPINLNEREIAIGSEIAERLKLKVGEEVTLAFAKGNDIIKMQPKLVRFVIGQIIHHGVYQKDERLVYARLADIQGDLALTERINMLVFKLQSLESVPEKKHVEYIENKLNAIKDIFYPQFFFKPFWRELASLIEAVQAEKVLISIILQAIIVIAIFNVLAFIIFLNEKKSKELFLFSALGMSKKEMTKLWLKLVFLIWSGACLLSIVMVQIFRVILLEFSLFSLPAEIYHMPRINLTISMGEYLFVFAVALLWVFLITFYLLKKLRDKSILDGLRQEFA